MQTLRLPSGATLQTPLLVPSVSSRGFGWHEVDDAPRSDVALSLAQVGTYLGDSLLVSAYDLSRGVLYQNGELLSGQPSMYSQLRLLVVDSGCYETEPRLTEQANGKVVEHKARWTPDNYEALLRRLPFDLDIAITSYDQYGDFGEQIGSAQRLFARFSNRMSICLLKPRKRGAYISVTDLVPHVADLHGVDAVGVTEKELGSSLRERICTVAKLRRALDDGKLGTPIHIFGGLDPLMTPLFFAAGAEIFDGLTWLRYGYFADVSGYRESAALLRDDLESPEMTRQHVTELRNLEEMRSLSNRLRELHRHDAWGGVNSHGDHLKHVYRAAMSHLEER